MNERECVGMCLGVGLYVSEGGGGECLRPACGPWGLFLH